MAKNNHDVAYVSPFGIARYPYTKDADTKFAEGGPGKFHLGNIITDDEATAFEAKCLEIFKKAFPDVKNLKNLSTPLKETEDGVKYIKGGSTYRPKVYDGKKRPISDDVELGGGSRIRIAGSLHPFNTGATKGVTLYLNDVQYTKLVAKGSGGAMGEVDGDDDSDLDDDAVDTTTDSDDLDI